MAVVIAMVVALVAMVGNGSCAMTVNSGGDNVCYCGKRCTGVVVMVGGGVCVGIEYSSLTVGITFPLNEGI